MKWHFSSFLPVLVAEVSSISRNSAQLLSITAKCLRGELQLMDRKGSNQEISININLSKTTVGWNIKFTAAIDLQ